MKIILCGALTLLLLTGQANAQQIVEGTQIDYPTQFLFNTNKSEQYMAALPAGAQTLIKSFYAYDASGESGIHEATLLKTTYVAGFIPSLDGAAQGAATSLSQLEGVKNVRITSQPLQISGLTARRVSVTADRWNGQIGIEALVAYEPKTNSTTQIQLIIGAQNSLSWSGILTEKRSAADKFLSSVKFVD
jgi:hypothetical protein